MTARGRTLRQDVAVTVEWGLDGRYTPKEIIWADGRRFPIERSTHPTDDGRSERPVRYDIVVAGHRRHLFHDPRGWFVERRMAFVP